MTIDDLSRAILHCEEGIETDDFNITQFTGTAFPCNYSCHHVTLRSEVTGTGNNPLPRDFVAKQTWNREAAVLYNLKKAGINVPKVYGSGHLDPQGIDILLFEEYIEGTELYEENTADYWIKLAESVGKMHTQFWNAQMIPHIM